MGVNVQALCRSPTAVDLSAYRREWARQLYAKLAQREQDTLLAIDNADNAEVVADYVQGQLQSTQVIITLRDARLLAGISPRLVLDTSVEAEAAACVTGGDTAIGVWRGVAGYGCGTFCLLELLRAAMAARSAC